MGKIYVYTCLLRKILSGCFSNAIEFIPSKCRVNQGASVREGASESAPHDVIYWHIYVTWHARARAQTHVHVYEVARSEHWKSLNVSLSERGPVAWDHVFLIAITFVHFPSFVVTLKASPKSRKSMSRVCRCSLNVRSCVSAHCSS